jgi:hemerythrin superfamily protein
VLQEQVKHHVKEEERDMFPRVAELFDQDELETLGEEMETITTQLTGSDPRMDLPKQTVTAAPVEGEGGKRAA